MAMDFTACFHCGQAITHPNDGNFAWRGKADLDAANYILLHKDCTLLFQQQTNESWRKEDLLSFFLQELPSHRHAWGQTVHVRAKYFRKRMPQRIIEDIQVIFAEAIGEHREQQGLQQKRCGIYALVDPRTHKVMYVGQSIDIASRYKQHCGLPQGYGLSGRSKWLIELRLLGLKPSLLILEEVKAQAVLTETERKWIHHYRTKGEAQCNIAMVPEEATSHER
jgi:hypothetical protein